MSQFEISFSTYLQTLDDKQGRDEIVKWIIKSLKKKKLLDTFSTIVFSGMSGAFIAPILADKLGKNLCGVRKKLEKSHSDYKLEGILSDKYLICDDIVDTFKTIKYIQKAIADDLAKEQQAFGLETPYVSSLTGLVLYGEVEKFKLDNFYRANRCWILGRDFFLGEDR